MLIKFGCTTRPSILLCYCTFSYICIFNTINQKCTIIKEIDIDENRKFYTKTILTKTRTINKIPTTERIRFHKPKP